MDMKEKWGKMLKGYYTTFSDDCFIWKITPGLIKEYEFFAEEHSLFGINVTDVSIFSQIVANTLFEDYEKTDKTLTFEQFREQRLLEFDMVETLKFMKSCGETN